MATNPTNVGSLTGIVGIPNPTQRYTRWAIHEVYGLGTEATNVHIVNVGDTVLDIKKHMEYVVIAVSPEGIPTLEPLVLNQTTGVRTEDTVLGTGPGLCSEGYRVYVNTKLIPSPFQIDTRVMINGSENAYVKIFRGHDTSNEGTVLSAMFNSAKRMTTENVPLEALTIPHKPNVTYKKPVGGHFTEGVQDGEVVTCVVYTNAGVPSARFRLLVVDTEFMRNIDESKKHIVDITLITPYLSNNDKLLVEFPIGMVAQSSSFLGKVTYNDGTYVTYPVDGTKFSLHGFDNFVASRLNDVTPVILNYRLSDTEFANNVRIVEDRRFTNKTYKLKTVESDNRYNVKLYPIIEWDSAKLEWKLTWWLYSLNRTAPVEVTRFIEIGANSRPFNGKQFGEAQEMTVAINLDRLGPSYAYFRHVEHFKITVLRPVVSTQVSSYYQVDFDSDSSIGNKTMIQLTGGSGNWTLDLSNGFPNEMSLLQAWYYNSEPLIYPYNELVAPKPNIIRLSKGNWVREIAVEDILDPIRNVNLAIANGDGFQAEFLRVSDNSRLFLGRISLVAQILN